MKSLTQRKSLNPKVVVLCAGLMIFICCSIFSNHWLGHWTFFGDSDRLNAFLNFRKFEVDSIQKWGRVPRWIDTWFMGFSADGLHFMVPGLGLIPWLESLFPIEWFYRISGYVSTFIYSLSSVSVAYLLWEILGHELAACAGGLLFAFSTFVLSRVTQVDTSLWGMVLMPMGILAIRKIFLESKKTQVHWFFIFSIIITAHFSMGSLQEVSYIVFMYGIYTIYLFLRRRDLNSFIIIAAAFLIGLWIGLPRLISATTEFNTLTRPKIFLTTERYEIWRWFYDGIFGQYFHDLPGVAPSINYHEGIQIFTSTFTPFLVLFGGFLFRNRFVRLAHFILIVTLTKIMWPFVPAILFAVISGLVLLWHERKKTLITSDSGMDDLAFHYLFLAFCLAIILMKKARYMYWLLFLKQDFYHGRLSMVANLSIAVIAAFVIRELIPAEKIKNYISLKKIIFLICTIIFTFLIWRGFIISLEVRHLFPGFHSDLPGHISKTIPYRPLGVFRIGVAFLISLFIFFLAQILSRKHKPLATYLYIIFILLTLMDGYAYFRKQVSGPQTKTYPIPFDRNNYMMVPSDVLNAPSHQAIERIQQKLETDQFRTALIFDRKRYHIDASPHIAPFWNVRLLGGYPILFRRLAELPWNPETLAGLRDLEFESKDQLDWPLLALVNVKYVVVVDPAVHPGFYFNVSEEKRDGNVEFSPDQLELMENPMKPLPRVFFAENVEPIHIDWTKEDVNKVQPSMGFWRSWKSRISRITRHGVSLHIDADQVSLVEDFPASRSYSTEGKIESDFRGDKITLRLTPSTASRFLVLNEMYHPKWKAYTADGMPLKIYPTNIVMRGIEVPPGVDRIELLFQPFMTSFYGFLISLSGLVFLVFVRWGWGRYFKRAT